MTIGTYPPTQLIQRGLDCISPAELFKVKDMKDLLFYVSAFLLAAGLPSWMAFMVSRKYEDPAVFFYSSVVVSLFVGTVLVVSYLRSRRLSKKHGQSQRPGA